MSLLYIQQQEESYVKSKTPCGVGNGVYPCAGDPDDWDKQTHINLMAPMRLTRMLLPAMKDAGRASVPLLAAALKLSWCGLKVVLKTTT